MKTSLKGPDNTDPTTYSTFVKPTRQSTKSILVLSLPNYVTWNVLILLVVATDFFLACLCFTLHDADLLSVVPLFFVFDFIYMFDMTLLLGHRFWKKLSNQLPEIVVTPSYIFAADLISIFPQVTLLLIYFRPDYRNLVLFCRILTCLRLHKLFFFRKMQRRFSKERCLWFLVQSLVYFLLTIHVLNTVWFLVTKNDSFCREKKLWNDTKINTNLQHSEDLPRWYFFTTFLSIQTFFNVGFGDEVATTSCEMFWFISAMLVGHMFCLTCVAATCWLLININYHRIMYQQMISYAGQYSQNTGDPTRIHIKSYHQELWKNYHGIDQASLLNLLPITLQMDVAYDVNCGLINRSLLLNNLPIFVQRKIALAMKNILLLPGQPIYFKDVTKKQLVCVENGILEVLYDEGDYSPAISFRRGAILGELSLFLNTSASNTVRALTNTEIKILEKVDFMKIMLDYPEELRKLRKIVAKRIGSIAENNATISSRNLKKLDVELYLTRTENFNLEYMSLYKMSKNFTSPQPGGISRIVKRNSALMKIWKFSLSVIQISLCLWYPYYAVFERYVPFNMYIFGIIADIMHFADVVLQCTTAVEFKDKTVSKIIDIIDINLDHWNFYCDVISLFPIEVWAFVVEKPSQRHRMYDLLKLNRLLRAWRVKHLLEFLCGRKSSVLWILKNITYISIFTYYVASGLYLTSCYTLFCNKGSWYHQKIIHDLEITNDIEYEASTLPVSLYFATMSVFYTGLGDILPKSDLDITLVILIILTSMVLKTYYLSQLVSAMFLEHVCKRVHEASFYLKECLNHFQLPKQMKNRMKKYVTSAAYFPDKYGPKFIKSNTSELLQTELQISNIQNILPGIPLFESADPYFLAMLETKAETFILPVNEILYHHGDCTKQMFIVKRGGCNLYNAHHELVKTVGVGAQLGVIEMLCGLSKKYTVIATTDCFMITIKYRTFSQISKLFPREHNALTDVLSSSWLLKMMEKLKPSNIDEDNKGIIYRKFTTNALMRIGWKNRWYTYKRKLGVFWFLAYLLLPFTINPSCVFLRIWCILRCLMILTLGLALPLLTTLPPFADFFYWLIFVCQCSLYLDMYILLHVSHFNTEGVLETDPLSTARYYITHSFAMDLLAALPLGQISLYFDPSHSSHYSDVVHHLAPHYRHCRWNLVHLVQFHRLFRYLGYVKTNSWRSDAGIRIVKVIVTLILIINVLTSLMLSIACNWEFDVNFKNTKNTQMFYSTVNSTAYFGAFRCGNDFWFNKSIFKNMSDPFELLLVGIYTVINFLTHTGVANISTNSWLPMMGIVVTSAIGFILFSWTCSVTATVFSREIAVGKDFRKEVEHLLWFLDKNDAADELKKKVVDHLKFVWRRNKGLNYLRVLDDLSFNSSLREDILLNQFHNCLKRCVLFYNLDIGSLRLIVKILRLHDFKKGEFVISYKDVIPDIYIVTSGEIQILSEDKQCVDTLGVGTVFGNISNSTRSCSRIYAKTRRNVELCTITTKELLELVKFYPHIFNKLKSILVQKSEYLEPYNLTHNNDQTDVYRVSDFWNEIESDEEGLPEKKSSMELINPLAVLKPHHYIFKVTEFLTFLASFINVLFIPYVFVAQDQDYLCYAYLIFEPIFFIRIYVKLRRSYYNFYGNFISSQRKIVQRYFNAPLPVLWDVTSNVPLSLACFAFNRDEWFFYYSCLRLLQLLRIYYVLQYFKFQEQKLKYRGWIPVVKWCMIYIMVIHLLSCFWLMLACPFNNCNANTWIVKNNDLLKKPPIINLLMSYYYIVSTITATGVKGILPQNLFEVVVTCVVMLLGKLMAIVFIGVILRTIYCSNLDVIRYEYKAAILKNHLQNQDLSRYQMGRICMYVQNLWNQEKGYAFPKLLRELPYGLTCNIMTHLYGHHLRHNVIFRKIDEALLRQICSKFQRLIFVQDNYIVKFGDINSCMYFIQRGQVTVLTKHPNFGETHHVLLEPNDMFGISQGFGQVTPHQFTYRAASHHVEVLALSFETWSYLLPHFPHDQAVILARAQKEHVKS